MPFSGVTAYGGVPPYQSQWITFASGPITAMDLMAFLSSGRKFFSFFSSTTDSSAILRETSRSLSVFHGSGESLMLVYGTIFGGSSNPSLMVMRNFRRNALSISGIVID